jgi:hypothetical protein
VCVWFVVFWLIKCSIVHSLLFHMYSRCLFMCKLLTSWCEVSCGYVWNNWGFECNLLTTVFSGLQDTPDSVTLPHFMGKIVEETLLWLWTMRDMQKFYMKSVYLIFWTVQYFHIMNVQGNVNNSLCVMYMRHLNIKITGSLHVVPQT